MSKCADPVLCFVLDSKKLYRHFSVAKNSVLIRYAPQSVFNCGKCLYCRKRKSRELAMRCVLHASLYKENCFLTLTYDETRKDYHNEFYYGDIQLFKKRLQSFVRRYYRRNIQIFNVHEYGRNGKKHWHLICLGFKPADLVLHTRSSGLPLSTSKLLQRIWPKGFSTVGDVSEASAMYQAQYTQKDFKNGNVTNSKKSHSKHSGLGRDYFLKHYKQLLELGYVPFQGRKEPLPRYFEKLAHKHYCHFYEPSAFTDTLTRKSLYRPFRNDGDAIRGIADLFIAYRERKELKILDLEDEWDEVRSHFLTTKETPDFIRANENSLYDLQNKNNLERF